LIDPVHTCLHSLTHQRLPRARTGENNTLQLQWSSLSSFITHSFASGLTAWMHTGSALADFYGAVYAGQFPNVTLPPAGFAAFGGDQLALASARAISFNPLVSSSQLAGWTAYALPIAPTFGPGVNLRFGGIYERNASNAQVATNQSRPFTAPVWQIAPWTGNAAAVFYDLHSQVDRRIALDYVLATRTPAVTDIIQLVQDTAVNITRASGIVFVPIFDGGGNATAGGPVVGFTSVVFSWDAFIANSLPSYASDVDVVLTSAAGRVWTFHIGNGAVTVVGQGDLHEHTNWENLGVTANLALGASFTIAVYPSSALINKYITTLRVTVTVGVVAVIVGITLVFLMYDYLQRHRVQLLARVAMVAGRIVGEVFPENVRDRLYAHTEQQLQQPTERSSVDLEASMRLNRMSRVDTPPTGLRTSDAGDAASGLFGAIKRIRLSGARASTTSRKSVDDVPIADTFDSCTVIFADIVSFTSWASTKPPERVFEVLEAIFREFDASAKRHDVFKIETIGDCWLGVAGVPHKSETHAQQMADFALSMPGRLARACTLCGMEMDELQIRIGIHSGSVTAGVLRAERTRFQLFGDCVNTAARMESTGQAGKVQCSASTAALLKAAGTHILERRGLIEAKGKGTVEAFWVLDSVANPVRERISTVSTMSTDEAPGRP